jgi:hypothetical protein
VHLFLFDNLFYLLLKRNLVALLDQLSRFHFERGLESSLVALIWFFVLIFLLINYLTLVLLGLQGCAVQRLLSVELNRQIRLLFSAVLLPFFAQHKGVQRGVALEKQLLLGGTFSRLEFLNFFLRNFVVGLVLVFL